MGNEPQHVTPEEAAGLFDTGTLPTRVAPLGNGLIHKTYAVYCGDSEPSYVLQRINTNVFEDVTALERNIAVVTGELLKKAKDRGDDPARAVQRFVPVRTRGIVARDRYGSAWRMSFYVAASVTVDVIKDPEMARKAAEAFARFHCDLWSLPADSVHPTIPNFHNTPVRYEALLKAARMGADRSTEKRLRHARPLLEAIAERSAGFCRIEEWLAAGRISKKVCHCDTKVSNLLLDRETNERLCVIDLDTLSPGSPLLDAGDLLRTGAATASEEETDISCVQLNPDLAEAIVDGFVSGLGTRLNRLEQTHVAFGGWLITMEQSIRYLTDYLLGDPYYGARHETHNLVRSKNQLALAMSMENTIVDISTEPV